jgi:hypothetical protein
MERMNILEGKNFADIAKEATAVGYSNGCMDSWNAQRMIVEMIIADWREHYGESGSVRAAKAILQAIDMSRVKAKEMMSARLEIQPLPHPVTSSVQ